MGFGRNRRSFDFPFSLNLCRFLFVFLSDRNASSEKHLPVFFVNRLNVEYDEKVYRLKMPVNRRFAVYLRTEAQIGMKKFRKFKFFFSRKRILRAGQRKKSGENNFPFRAGATPPSLPPDFAMSASSSRRDSVCRSLRQTPPDLSREEQNAHIAMLAGDAGTSDFQGFG